MAATNVQAFSGDVEISSNLTAPFITGLGYVTTRTHTFNPTGNTSKYFLGWTTEEGMEIEINDNGFSHGSTQRFYITYSYDQTPYLSSADVSDDKVYNFYYTKKNGRVYIWFNETRDSSGNNVNYTIRMKTLKNAINLTEPGAAETYEGTVIGVNNVSAFPAPILFKQEGRVGIGTTSPVTPLDLLGGDASNNMYMSIRNSGNANDDKGVGILFENIHNSTRKSLGHILALRTNNAGHYGSYLRFSTADIDGTAQEHMRIDNYGRVGIGMTNPISRLNITQDFGGNGPFVPVANVVVVDGSTRYGMYVGEKTAANPFTQTCLRCIYDTDTIFIVDGYNRRVGIGKTDPDASFDFKGDAASFATGDGRLHIWGVDKEGYGKETMLIQTTIDDRAWNSAFPYARERLCLQPYSGEVGIGTDFPVAKLTIGPVASLLFKDDRGISSARNWALRVNNSNEGDFQIGCTSSNTGGLPNFYSNPGDAKMTINRDGQVILNGTGVLTNAAVLYIYCTGSSPRQDASLMKAAVDTNIIMWFLNTANGSRGYITGVNATSIQYNTTSDVRLKKQIKPMQSTLDRVKALKPSKFTWIRDEAKGYGFIAQEVYKVFPEMRPVVPYSGCTCKCGEERCESCTLCDDEHDYPKNKDGTDFYYGLDYGLFTPFLTKAIQELDEKVEEHHNRKSLVTDVDYSTIGDYEGLVVSASTNNYKNGRPTLKLSVTENDKTCYGVILGKAESIDNETNIQKSGDGRMWVINTHGNLESGDLVTTSGIGGYGKKQDDDILRSYTVAKLTQDCDFTEKHVVVKRVKQEWKDITYYIQENYVKADDHTVSEYKGEIFERIVPMYAKSVGESEDSDTKIFTPDISEEDYQALTEEEKRSYTITYLKTITPYEYNRISEAEKIDYQEFLQKGNYTKEVYESTTPMPECCGEYTSEIRQELVNVLDEHGQIQWEDDPSGATEKAYEIRYLDADGNITDEANHVYKAAFVGCTYHCG